MVDRQYISEARLQVQKNSLPLLRWPDRVQRRLLGAARQQVYVVGHQHIGVNSERVALAI